NTADTLNLNQAVITNAADTTATVYSLNDLNYSLTSGTVVASTAAKDDNYLYAYVVMGSSDQCHFGYVRDTDSDFYLRAL
ncbi:MAG: hypothetical protein GWN76_08975, partial [candidate division Zixibacteria bacterium]|nr:hypothetical protein [candidate division Zixibacteria bacterium]NIU14127.1 hypothetical protein [candidate division Zixibacteria bacterium]NIW44936.1 hypothetical protein [Gammaproteobacteria bacterium]